MANGCLWRDNFPSGTITTDLDGQSYTVVGSWSASAGVASTTVAHSKLQGVIGTGDIALRVTVVHNPDLNVGVLVRYTNSTNWLGFARLGGGSLAVYKNIGGVLTQLATTAGASDGDIWQISIIGTTAKFIVNGSTILTYTIVDAVLLTGTHFSLESETLTTQVGFSEFTVFGTATHPATWIVDPAGVSVGDGSPTAPLDWRTAMGHSLVVLGGDLVSVHGGVHGTSGDPLVKVTIHGTAGNYIDVKRYPGENWPVMRTGLETAGGLGYVRFWGFQFAQDNFERINNYRGDNPTYGNGGVNLRSPYTEFHYCIVANNAMQGWGYWEDSVGAVVHMCLTYYNGFRDLFDGLPAVQGFYRQSDDNGTGIYQTIDTCITGLNYQTGMQMYGSGRSNLNFGKTLNSFWFWGGGLGASYSGGQGMHEILLGSTSVGVSADKIYFDNNWLWPISYGAGVQLGYNGQNNTFVSWTNNVVRGPMRVQYFRTLEATGNTHINYGFNQTIDNVYTSSVIGALPTPAGAGIDHNAFYVSNDGDVNNHGPFVWNDGLSNHSALDPAGWYTLTGFEQHSSLGSYGTQSTMFALAPNTVEPTELWPTPRAFLYVFNFENLAAINVDISALFSVGDFFVVYDWGVYELDAPPFLTWGQYAGGDITVPMREQPLPALNADPTGTRSQHDPLPTFAAGQPGAYIIAQVPGPLAPDLNPWIGRHWLREYKP